MRAGGAGARRGYTLIELVVALTISGLTVAAAISLLVQQQRTYAATSSDRGQQEAGRLALQDLLTRLEQAGYGVDPNLTFDFGLVDRAPRTGLMPPAAFVQQSSYLCDDPVDCRDRTDGSDEIVFIARNPWFRRVTDAVDTGTVTIIGELKKPLYRGQILQVSCLGGSQTRAYVTVARYVAAAAAPDPLATVDIQLEPGQQAGGLDVFPFENAQLVDGCFSATLAGTEPVVTLVDRSRFYVGWYLAGAVVAEQTDGARPYLMLDQGLVDETGVPIRLPVAPEVEDLQFTYLYSPAVAGGPPRIVGATEGIPASADAFPMTVGAVVPPAMLDVADDPTRLTGHPANIQAVRVAVTVRQPSADVGIPDAEGAVLDRVANRPQLPATPYRRRWLWETTVVLRNQASAYYVYPVL